MKIDFVGWTIAENDMEKMMTGLLLASLKAAAAEASQTTTTLVSNGATKKRTFLQPVHHLFPIETYVYLRCPP